MNKQTEALKLALECIEAWDRGGNASDYWRDRFDAITAIREALAEQPAQQQEPVAWGIANTRPTESKPLMMVMLDEPPPSHLVIPLYATPPRQWVGLTDDEIALICAECSLRTPCDIYYARAIEAKLREKNQ